MSITILEALQNADYNLKRPSVTPVEACGKRQLHNAVVLLGKGYSLCDKIEPLLEKYYEIENVPPKGE